MVDDGKAESRQNVQQRLELQLHMRVVLNECPCKCECDAKFACARSGAGEGLVMGGHAWGMGMSLVLLDNMFVCAGFGDATCLG